MPLCAATTKIRLFPEPKNKKEQKIGGCHRLEIKTSRNLRAYLCASQIPAYVPVCNTGYSIKMKLRECGGSVTAPSFTSYCFSSGFTLFSVPMSL